MVSKWILPGLLLAAVAYGSSVFTEDTELWVEIDRINTAFVCAGKMDSDSLEELFRETVEMALFLDLSLQFEDLRTDAFLTDNYDEIDEYADRAADAITVMILGESNNIGVNTIAFLDRSAPESEAYFFFLVAVGGFYADGENQTIGTAELPAWMERAGSSAQALVDPVKAAEWLGYWQNMRPSLDGYFLTIADETILGLSAVVE